jgi:hypothetical protein
MAPLKMECADAPEPAGAMPLVWLLRVAHTNGA